MDARAFSVVALCDATDSYGSQPGARASTKQESSEECDENRRGCADWKQAAELEGSDTVAADYFGYSVAISGTTAVVGADGHDKSAGRAYVFEA